MNRSNNLSTLRNLQAPWEVLIIGGGATGLGIALDSALRGYRTVLLEAGDFASGTSSRSTKLIHGGVRYLAKGDLGLVMEALHERGILASQASEWVHTQAFIIPFYRVWEGPIYATGLFLYDLLAGRRSLGASRYLSRKTVITRMPGIKTEGLKGGILYYDGQFDDARFALHLARCASQEGACLLNYLPVTELLKNAQGKMVGVNCQDAISGEKFQLNAHCVINATGVFADSLFRMDVPATPPKITPSRGSHIVLDASFLPGNLALMIPHTKDGRVLFVIPWQGKLIAGTTDIPTKDTLREPVPEKEEIGFILEALDHYFGKEPHAEDVLSVYAGLRPLAAMTDPSRKTKEISRRHKILVSSSGMVSVYGGKWTTFRRMAKDTLDKAIQKKLLPQRRCTTAHYDFNGSGQDILYPIQSDSAKPEKSVQLHPNYPWTEEMVRHTVREEMALFPEDVLSRRFRALILDARMSMEIAPRVTEIMALELAKDEQWVQEKLNDFLELAEKYTLK